MQAAIQKKAMLIRLNISSWTARKHDKTATAEVESRHGTTDAGRFNKILIDPARIKAIQSKANTARNYFYKVTLPWCHDGSALLPSALYFEAQQELDRLRREWEQEVQGFLDDYDQERERARLRLNGLFREDDYPTASQLLHKYSFSWSVDSIPDGSDFRIDLGEEERAKIQEDIERRSQAAAAAAIRDLYKRVSEIVGNVSAKMKEQRDGDKPPIFRDTLIDNVKEIAELLPGLNFTDDPGLKATEAEIKKKLANLNPETLRASDQARKEAAEDADAILKMMGGYING